MSSKEKDTNAIHPALQYLSTPEISDILSKGLSVLYEKNPKNPVEFLALWLLNHSNEHTIKLKVKSLLIDLA